MLCEVAYLRLVVLARLLSAATKFISLFPAGRRNIHRRRHSLVGSIVLNFVDGTIVDCVVHLLPLLVTIALSMVRLKLDNMVNNVHYLGFVRSDLLF